MLKKKSILCLVVVITALVLFSAPTQTTKGADPTGTLADIIDRGYVEVGSDIPYPPFEDNYDPDTGQAEGFDIDIWHVIADSWSETYDTDIGVKFVLSSWDPIIPNLQAKKFDVITSAMTITADREIEVDFTRWYYQSKQGILVETGNPLNITKPEDLNTTGISVGVQIETTSNIWLDENNVSTTQGGNAEVKTYPDFPAAILALKQGTVDAVMGDIAVLILDAAQSAETEVAWQGLDENFGIACRTGDDDLRLAINAVLNTLLGTDEANPVISDLYNAIYYKWHDDSHYLYEGIVTSTDIPYNWYEEEEDGLIPGFEVMAILPFLIAITLIIRHRKRI